ncbi:MAG TPA: BtpA/SgcQ family protein [Tepidisphaeraceae bacterium]|nr:BtpA/SgcQ family protein [Tepidisphaeraceae bacterium]
MFENIRHPVIGMLHLRPLSGSPRSDGNLDAVKLAMLRDAEALAEGGVHGLMLENFGDVPFYPTRVPEYVVAQMTALAAEVRRRFPLPLGINVLRNDGCAALAVAHACGAQFIRVNVLCGARVADQGIIQGIAHDLLRLRATLKCDVKIFADIGVKHSAPLAARSIEDEVSDTLHRGLADALIASGSGTGKPTDPSHVRQIKAAAGGARVFVGSGANADSVSQYLSDCDGFIIGSAFKRGGDVEQPVEVDRIRRILSRIGG